MARRANGKGLPSLSGAVSSLQVEETERLELGTIWVDLLIPNPANQTFRARARKMKEQLSAFKDASIDDITTVISDDGQFTDEVIELVHTIYLEDWGGYDSNGVACALYDDEGEEAPCTFDNFRSVVCDMPGGGAFFMALQKHIALMNARKVATVSTEKNSLKTSPVRSASAARRPTRKGQKPALA